MSPRRQPATFSCRAVKAAIAYWTRAGGQPPIEGCYRFGYNNGYYTVTAYHSNNPYPYYRYEYSYAYT